MGKIQKFMALLQKKIDPEEYTPCTEGYETDPLIIENKNQAIILAQQLLKQAQNSADLINTTVTPEVFFSRYDFLISRFDLLSRCARWVPFSGMSPAKSSKELRSLEKRTAVVNDFLARYKEHVNIKVQGLKTAKGQKSNLEKMYRGLMRFDYCLSPEQIAEMNHFFDDCFSNLPTNESRTATHTDPFNENLPPAHANIEWELSLSFGHSKSPAFHQARYLWEHTEKHLYFEDPAPIYQCFYSKDPKEFMAYLQLYEIVKGWKTTAIMINGTLVDKKIMEQINYCYGDKCRSGKKNFCFGTGPYSANPFGCHRLQMDAYLNPWYSYGYQQGTRYIIDKSAIWEILEENSTAYRLCPALDMNEIFNQLEKLPTSLSLNQIKELDPMFYYSLLDK